MLLASHPALSDVMAGRVVTPDDADWDSARQTFNVLIDQQPAAIVVVYAAYMGSEADGRRLLAPMRALEPAIDTFAMVPPAGLGDLAMDPPDPLPYLTTHHLLGELTPAAVDALLAAAGPGSGSVLPMVQLRHMGGALARTAPGAGARTGLPGEIALLGLGMVMDEDMAVAVEASLGALYDALLPYRVGDYPNFVEHPVDASGFFDPATWTRLREVKALYDPEDVFKGNHHIPPAE